MICVVCVTNELKLRQWNSGASPPPRWFLIFVLITRNKGIFLCATLSRSLQFIHTHPVLHLQVGASARGVRPAHFPVCRVAKRLYTGGIIQHDVGNYPWSKNIGMSNQSMIIRPREIYYYCSKINQRITVNRLFPREQSGRNHKTSCNKIACNMFFEFKYGIKPRRIYKARVTGHNPLAWPDYKGLQISATPGLRGPPHHRVGCRNYWIPALRPSGYISDHPGAQPL